MKNGFASKQRYFRPQAAQAHYMNADVTLACEWCCVTNGYAVPLSLAGRARDKGIASERSVGGIANRVNGHGTATSLL